jgi:hypothetical protein
MDTLTLKVEIEHDVMPLLKQLLENFKGVKKVTIAEEVVAYTTKDEPLFAYEMREIINKAIEGIDNGTHAVYTSDEVLKSILKK